VRAHGPPVRQNTVGAPPRPVFQTAKAARFTSGFLCRGSANFLVYSLGFLSLAACSLHDVVPTLGGGVVLAADRVAVDVGGRAHG
jgi:hypothetical protein